MKTFFHYVMTDQDARILFPFMVVLGLFVLSVSGRVVLCATRPIRLKRKVAKQHKRAARRQKRAFKYMQKTGEITNATAREQQRQTRNWGQEGHEKFGGHKATVPLEELANTGEFTAVPTRK